MLISFSGVNFALRDKENYTPLLWLARREDNHNSILYLLQNGVIPEQQYHPKGKTLLHVLAKASKKDVNMKLIKEIVEQTGKIIYC